jgi:hypothetical protein
MLPKTNKMVIALCLFLSIIQPQDCSYQVPARVNMATCVPDRKLSEVTQSKHLHPDYDPHLANAA